MQVRATHRTQRQAEKIQKFNDDRNLLFVFHKST
jgi:hypothetical protein